MEQFASKVTNIRLYSGFMSATTGSLNFTTTATGGSFDPLIFSTWYTINPGDMQSIQVVVDFEEESDNLHVNACKVQVVLTGIDINTNQQVSHSATGKKTYIKQCLATTKLASVEDYILSNTPWFGVPAGTFTVHNLSPGTISLSGCMLKLQGTLAGLVPKTDFIQVVNVTTGGSLGTEDPTSASSNFYMGFNPPVSLEAGDSIIAQCLLNIPFMEAGDEITIAATFMGEFAPYAPWAIPMQSFVMTQPTVGQKITYEAPSGIEAVAEKIRFMSTGNEVRITVTTSEPWNLDVYTLMGQQVSSKQSTNQTETFSSSDLAAGTYLTCIRTAQATSTKKFIMLE